jgi:hypothetical protein
MQQALSQLHSGCEERNEIRREGSACLVAVLSRKNDISSGELLSRKHVSRSILFWRCKANEQVRWWSGQALQRRKWRPKPWAHQKQKQEPRPEVQFAKRQIELLPQRWW